MLAGTTLTTTETTVFTATNRTSISLILCNKSSSNAVDIEIKLSGITIVNTTLQSKETMQLTQIMIDANDSISARASVDNAVDIVITGLEV